MNQTIYLAGGCFWGVQAYMKKLPGVIETETGYANGKTEYVKCAKRIRDMQRR